MMSEPLHATDPHTPDDVAARRRLVLEQRQMLTERDRDIIYKDAKIAALTIASGKKLTIGLGAILRID